MRRMLMVARVTWCLFIVVGAVALSACAESTDEPEVDASEQPEREALVAECGGEEPVCGAPDQPF
jgi:hypothetical protein